MTPIRIRFTTRFVRGLIRVSSGLDRSETQTLPAPYASPKGRPLSAIRRLIAFANATHRDLLTVDEAWNVTTLSRLPEADRESMRQAIKAHFDEKAYARELKGEPTPVEPTQGELSQVLQDGLNESRQREARATFSKA